MLYLGAGSTTNGSGKLKAPSLPPYNRGEADGVRGGEGRGWGWEGGKQGGGAVAKQDDDKCPEQTLYCIILSQ